MQAYNSHSYFRGVWCIWDTGDLDIPCQKGGNMERKRWGASVNHCVMSHPQKTWWSTSSHLYICFLRNESAPINYKATGCKISGLQLLLLGISAFYLHTGSVSGWRQVRTAVPGTTSSQRQRRMSLPASPSQEWGEAVQPIGQNWTTQLLCQSGFSWTMKAILCILDRKAWYRVRGAHDCWESWELSLMIREFEPAWS